MTSTLERVRSGWLLAGAVVAMTMPWPPARLSAQQSDGGSIRGVVRDALTGVPVAGVHVGVVGSAPHATTDAAGTFVLRGVPTGTQQLTALALGYRPARIDRVHVAAGGATSVSVRLDHVAVALADVVVTPGHYAAFRATATRGATLTREEIEAAPQIGDDVYRSIERLPGVASDEYSAKLTVRGGTDREMLVRLDGVTLYEPFHLKDLDGALSIIDVQTVGQLDLITGGFAAEYGDRLTGVLDMRSRDDAQPGAHGEVGLSITNARALSSGEFAGERGHWLVSARRGYLDLVLDMVGDQRHLSPRYSDAFSKVDYQLGEHSRLAAHALVASDGLHIGETGGTHLDARYANAYWWGTWDAHAGPLDVSTVVSDARLTWNRVGHRDRLTQTVLGVDDHREFTAAAAEQDWMVTLAPWAVLKWGASIRDMTADYAYMNWKARDTVVAGKLTTSTDSLRGRVAPTGTSRGAYISQRLRGGPLTADLGVRWDEVSFAPDGGRAQPRLGLALDLGAATTLRGGWGYYDQAPGLYELDIADGDTVFHAVERAEQRVASVEHRLRDGTALRVEVYDRRLSRIAPHPLISRLGIDVLSDVSDYRVLVAPTAGRARGIELLAQHPAPARGLGWSASYALATTVETIDGRDVPAPLDQRHTLRVDGTYRPSAQWSVGAAWMIHSGWPDTPVSYVAYPLATGGVHFEQRLGPIESDRLPAYHRLDVRATRRVQLRTGELWFFVDVFNAYDRANTFRYDYSPVVTGASASARRQPDTLLPILPTFGVRWAF